MPRKIKSDSVRTKAHSERVAQKIILSHFKIAFRLLAEGKNIFDLSKEYPLVEVPMFEDYKLLIEDSIDEEGDMEISKKITFDKKEYYLFGTLKNHQRIRRGRGEGQKRPEEDYHPNWTAHTDRIWYLVSEPIDLYKTTFSEKGKRFKSRKEFDVVTQDLRRIYLLLSQKEILSYIAEKQLGKKKVYRERKERPYTARDLMIKTEFYDDEQYYRTRLKKFQKQGIIPHIRSFK